MSKNIDHYQIVLGFIDKILQTPEGNKLNWAGLEHNDPDFAKLFNTFANDLNKYKDQFTELGAKRTQTK